MNTNKFQRQGYKDTVKEFGKFDEVYGAHVILNLLDDIDTLESENARLREAVRVMREFLSTPVCDCYVHEEKHRNDCEYSRFFEVLSTVDTLPKSEDKE